MGECCNRTSKRFLLGVFDDEARLLHATEEVHKRGFRIHDVYTPYAVHGLDDAMGIRRSRLPLVTFVAGGIGLLFAIFFQCWVFGISWPIIVGGKPFKPIPAFVPVAFEITVLIGGLVTVLAFLVRSRLAPGCRPMLIDPRVTDNRFVIALERSSAEFDEKKITDVLRELGAVEVNVREVNV